MSERLQEESQHDGQEKWVTADGFGTDIVPPKVGETESEWQIRATGVGCLDIIKKGVPYVAPMIIVAAGSVGYCTYWFIKNVVEHWPR